MDGNLERTAMLRLKRTAENLQKNGMETHILQRREEVVPCSNPLSRKGRRSPTAAR